MNTTTPQATDPTTLTLEIETRDNGRVALSAWRGRRIGQPDIDGYYVPSSGDTSGICGATEAEADEIATRLDLTPADIGDAIRGAAIYCAELLRQQGWRGDSAGYDLGVYPGDVADLTRLLDREPTAEERKDLEQAIRAELDRTATRPACRSCGSYQAAEDSDYCGGCSAAIESGESPATAYAG